MGKKSEMCKTVGWSCHFLHARRERIHSSHGYHRKKRITGKLQYTTCYTKYNITLVSLVSNQQWNSLQCSFACVSSQWNSLPGNYYTRLDTIECSQAWPLATRDHGVMNCCQWTAKATKKHTAPICTTVINYTRAWWNFWLSKIYPDFLKCAIPTQILLSLYSIGSLFSLQRQYLSRE